jgi:ankyrin repeat protein
MPAQFEVDLKENKAEDCQKALTCNRPFPMDIRNKASQNALMIACAYGARDVVEMLFTMDGTHDLEAVDADGWTALHHASYQGFKEILNILCHKGADPSATTNSNQTGLHLAVQAKKQNTVMELLTLKCPLDIQTSPGGQTALHLALQKDDRREKNEDISLMLLQNGPDVRLKDIFGQTALHFAARTGLATAIEKLIQLGADVNGQDSKF